MKVNLLEKKSFLELVFDCKDEFLKRIHRPAALSSNNFTMLALRKTVGFIDRPGLLVFVVAG